MKKLLSFFTLGLLTFSLLFTPASGKVRAGAKTTPGRSVGGNVAQLAPPTPPFDAPWLSFNTAFDSTSGRPVALATGDADGDGDRDVVAARAFAQGGFVLLLNEGAGRFSAPVSYSGTGNSAGIVMTDLNGDGALDVAVTDSDALTSGNTVSVYLGVGNGTFGSRQGFSVGTGAVVPIGIVAADFDADGDVDLAVAAYGSTGSGSTVVLLRNNGNGTFAAPISFPAGPKPSDLAVGDLNGDGRPDLVVGNLDYEVNVLINNGSGGFAPRVAYANLNTFFAGNFYPAVALGDLDRDGDIDVLYGNTQTSTGTTGHVVQLRNTGTGTLTRAADIPLVANSGGPADLATADLNGDGALDILATSRTGRTSDGYYVILNNGTGGFGPAVLYPAGQSTSAVAAADVDGNGALDVLTADEYSIAITVHLNPGTGLFPTLADDFADFNQSFMDAADIDGDGDLDIFTSGSHPAQSEGTILRNDGTGRFLNRTAINNGLDGIAAGVLRDLNGDGKPDLLFNNSNTAPESDFFTALNNGDGTFGPIVRWVLNSGGLAEIDAFDLDGDGDLDVVDMGSVGSGSFYIALNNGNGTFQTPSVYNQLPGGPEDVVGGDFNHDGKIDLAMTDNGLFGFDARVFIVLGNGNGTFGAPIVYTVGGGPLYLVTADFDQDGNLDLATINTGLNGPGNESVTLLFGTGTGSFSRITSYYAPYSPDLLGATGITAGDLDGDGDLDIVTTGVSNDVAIYFNDGAGNFSFPYRLGAFAGTHWPLFADFTGDGVADLAVLSHRLPLGLDSGVGILRGVTAGATDTVQITRAQYSSRKSKLTVQATDSDPTAILTVSVTSTGTILGNMTNKGGGNYTAKFTGISNPLNITVTSNLGGSASAPVTGR